MSNFKKNHLNIQNLALMAVLLAAEIMLSRFLSLQTPIVKIGFAFIPVAIAARKMGAQEAVIVAALGDFLGALLFPVGAYFPGFTLTAAMKGLCSGLFLHKKCSLGRITASVLINEIFGSLLLNTLWLSILFGSPFFAILPTRLLQAAILAIVQVLSLWMLLLKAGKFLDPKQSLGVLQK
ncbi:MAG: folate family ECF transporter S component [Oscillospiraceae bacterium]